MLIFSEHLVFYTLFKSWFLSSFINGYTKYKDIMYIFIFIKIFNVQRLRVQKNRALYKYCIIIIIILIAQVHIHVYSLNRGWCYVNTKTVCKLIMWVRAFLILMY